MVELITTILGLIETGVKTVPQLIAAAKQSGELTDAQAAAFEQRMAAAFASDAWKTDAQRAGK